MEDEYEFEVQQYIDDMFAIEDKLSLEDTDKQSSAKQLPASVPAPALALQDVAGETGQSSDATALVPPAKKARYYMTELEKKYLEEHCPLDSDGCFYCPPNHMTRDIIKVGQTGGELSVFVNFEMVRTFFRGLKTKQPQPKKQPSGINID
jgi:hypothetical protein